MHELEAISDLIPLPTTPEGWFDYGYTPLADGRLALIRTRKDIHGEHMRWWEAAKGGWRSPKYPKVWDDHMRLSIFDGSAETDVAVMPSGAHPKIDRLPNGQWLVAGSRAHEGEKNGVIYSPDGQTVREIVLGDGIETVLCAPDGTIWVGYFDEGVFGGPNKDGSWPVSSGGLVQFDASGRKMWSFNDEQNDDSLIDDIYAMTLCGNELWACYYSGFPIIRIEGGKPVFWSNGVAGAKAIAVKDEIVMLAVGYSEDSNRIAVLKLDGSASRKLGEIRYPQGALTAAGLVQGRGEILHIVSDKVWYKTPVRRAFEVITERRST